MKRVEKIRSRSKVRIVPLRSAAKLKLLSSTGLMLEGAAWRDGRLALNDGQTVSLRTSQLTWRNRDEVQERADLVNLPVYLNRDRSHVLFSVDLLAERMSQAMIAQRGACLTLV